MYFISELCDKAVASYALTAYYLELRNVVRHCWRVLTDSFIKSISDRPHVQSLLPWIPLQMHDSGPVCPPGGCHLVVQRSWLQTDLVSCCCVFIFRVVWLVKVAMAAARVPLSGTGCQLDLLFCCYQEKWAALTKWKSYELSPWVGSFDPEKSLVGQCFHLSVFCFSALSDWCPCFSDCSLHLVPCR